MFGYFSVIPVCFLINSVSIPQIFVFPLTFVMSQSPHSAALSGLSNELHSSKSHRFDQCKPTVPWLPPDSLL